MDVHSGHRKNLRQEFLKNGINGKKEYQVLELLLTYAIPRVDVNPLAHRLINEFGSLAGVMDADVEELMRIGHITENGAVLIKLIPQLSRMYNESKWGEKPVLNNSNRMIEFAKSRFYGEKNETFYMLAMDTKCRLNSIEKISSGTVDASNVYIRNVVSLVLKANAKFIALIHNHPSGNVLPSAEDVAVTEKIRDALKTINVEVIDHIIISGDNAFCFSQNGLI